MNGHTVETVDNGLQALERLKGGSRYFDVLITDLQMPVMDGFESVREYRKWEECFLCLSDTIGDGKGDSKRGGMWEGTGEAMGENVQQRRLYIVGMSANSDEQSVKDALAAGMDDFVAKPFNYDVLSAILKGALLGARGN